MKRRTAKRSEVGAVLGEAVEVVSVAFGVAVAADDLSLGRVGQERLGVVAAADGALDGLEVVPDGPLLGPEDGLHVVGACPTGAADGETLVGVRAPFLVVGENGRVEHREVGVAAF